MMKRLFISSLLSLSLVSQAVAFVVPSNSGWVTDLADIFTPQQEVDITTKLTAIASWYDAEIAVLTLPSLEGEEIDMVGTQIAQERWIGNEVRDTWVLVLIAPNERKWRIDVGYGLEWNLPDAYAYRYGENYLVPAFREERYADGVMALLAKLEAHLDGKPQVESAPLINDFHIMLFFVWGMIMLFILSLYKSKKSLSQKKAIGSLWIRSGVLAILTSPFVAYLALIFFVLWFLGSVMLYVAPTVQVNSHGSRTSRGGGGTFSGGFGGFGWGSFGGGGASGGR